MIHNINLRCLINKKNSVPGLQGCCYDFSSVYDSVDLNGDSSKSSEPKTILLSSWKELVSTCTSGKELVIKTQSPGKSNCIERESFSFIREFSETKCGSIRYSSVLFSMRLVIFNLDSPGETTMRDIYYRDVIAFNGSQKNSNLALRRICRSLKLSMVDDLNIIPSPKGLIWGGPEIKLEFSSEFNFDLGYDYDLSIIPNFRALTSIHSQQAIQAVVIIEKEAVLRSFSNYVKNSPYSMILISGKGFPDHATKVATQALQKKLPHVPIIAFFDSDVFGLRIYWQYLCASQDPTSIQLAGAFLLEYERDFLTIAKREWKLIMGFLKEIQSSKLFESARNTKLIRRELQRGMLLAKKAEMNAICDSTIANALNDYMMRKVMRVSRAGDIT